MRQFNIAILTGVCILSSLLYSQTSPLDSLVSLIKKSQQDTSLVKSYNSAAFYAAKILPDSGIHYAAKALELSQKHDFKRGMAAAYYNIALFNQYKGNYYENNSFGEKAMAIYKELGNEKKVFDCYNLIGNGYSAQGTYDKALEYHLTSLKGRERLKDSTGIALSFMNIGRIHRVQGEYSKAIDYYNKALALSKKRNLYSSVANCYNNIGNVYYYQKKYDSSLIFQYRSLEVNLNHGDTDGMLTNYTNIAGNYFNQKNYDSALKYYNRALIIGQRLGDKVVLASCYEGFAAIYGEQKQYARSIEFFNKALAISKEIGDVDFSSGLYRDLADVYALNNNYKEAFTAHKNYKLFYDSLFNQNSTRKLTEASLKYEFEKQQEKEKEESLRKELLQKEKSKSQQQLIYIFSVGFLIVLVLLFISVRNYRLKQKVNTELELKNEVIEEKNRDITDSIKYAKRLQDAILPTTQLINKCFNEAFVVFKPKDIVSGDFYWMDKIRETVFFAVVDCTGHGVPGAFMSIMAHNLIQQAIHEKDLKDPAEILNYINNSLNEKLNSQEINKVNDGMDIALCAYDTRTSELKYAGANNPLWIINKNGELKEITANKFSIGFQNTSLFKQQTETIEKGSMIYLLSDGYADQFGGQSGKKLMKKTVKNILCSISNLSAVEQEAALINKMNEWKGNLQQVDDICIMGIRV